jgi:hypothetical protein
MTHGLAAGTAVQAGDAGVSGFFDQYAEWVIKNLLQMKVVRVVKLRPRKGPSGVFENQSEFQRDPLNF